MTYGLIGERDLRRVGGGDRRLTGLRSFSGLRSRDRRLVSLEGARFRSFDLE